MERNMHRSLVTMGTLLVAGMIFLAMGCCPNSFLQGVCPTATELDYGHSVANNKAHMILNPEAYRKVETSVGMSPKAAVNTMETYNKSFTPSEQKGTTLKLTTEK